MVNRMREASYLLAPQRAGDRAGLDEKGDMLREDHQGRGLLSRDCKL